MDGSVRPDEGFEMGWELYGDKQRQVRAIADAAKQADRLILATDPDREGEAISWHVQELLKKRRVLPKDVQRVTFNAITKDTVTKAMTQPRELDQDLIDAYLARRAGSRPLGRSEEHTSELQSLMRISYAVFCLKKKQK